MDFRPRRRPVHVRGGAYVEPRDEGGRKSGR